MARRVLSRVYRQRVIDPRDKRTVLAFIPFVGCRVFFKQIVIIPSAHCSAAQSDFKAFCTVAKLHPTLSEMCFSILANEVGFAFPPEPGREWAGRRREPSEPAQGSRAHLGALLRRGRGRAARAGPSEVPVRALPGGAKLAGNRPATIPSPQPLSPSPPPPQPTPLHRLLSPPRPALQINARPSACAQGLGCGSLSDQHLELLCSPPRPAEAPCAPQPTTRGDNKADVHHVACSFQKGQILTSVP